MLVVELERERIIIIFLLYLQYSAHTNCFLHEQQISKSLTLHAKVVNNLNAPR